MTTKINDGFFEELSRSPGVSKLVDDTAERVAAAARASAPVDSGDYRDQIGVEHKNQKRRVALVVAKDPKSLLIEAKTGNLVRALRGVKRG